MKFNIEYNDEKVREAAAIVIKHFQDEAFLALVRNVEKFNHTPMNGNGVSSAIRNMRLLEINIKPYKTFNPWSKAIGYASGNTIFINTRKSLPLYDRVENLYHEALHLIGFSHKGNYVTEYNLKTVPYLVSSMFIKYCREIYK